MDNSVALLIAGALVVIAVNPPARAYGGTADTLGVPEAESEGEQSDQFVFTFGNEFTTAYFYRGILQERDGFITQPYAEMSMDVYRGTGFISAVDLGMGLWFSIQTDKTNASGSGPSNLYEADYYPSLSVRSSEGVSAALIYRVQTSPNGAFNTIQSLDLGFTYDDSRLLGPLAIGPTATFSFGLENSALSERANLPDVFDTQPGGYMELAGAPSVPVSLPGDRAQQYPVTLSFPIALGLSLYDYYRTATHNQTFGFVSFGANAEIPLAFIPDRFGDWSASVGIDVLVLSETLTQVNDGDNPFPVGTLGIEMEY